MQEHASKPQGYAHILAAAFTAACATAHTLDAETWYIIFSINHTISCFVHFNLH
jgi:hypothetical protein